MVLPETIVHDLKFGIRALLLSRWSTVITILSLELSNLRRASLLGGACGEGCWSCIDRDGVHTVV